MRQNATCGSFNVVYMSALFSALYNTVNTNCASVLSHVRAYTEAVSLYSVSSSVKPILTSRQKYAVTRRFTIRTSTLRATYVSTFWGLFWEADTFVCLELNYVRIQEKCCLIF